MARHIRTAATTVASAVMLAACGGGPAPEALLGTLTGDVACEAEPQVEDGRASCRTVAGDGIVASHQDEDPGFLFALTLDDRDRDNVYVWHPDQRWTVLAPDEAAAEEIARQLGGEAVTQTYFDEEFLDR